MLPSEQLAGFEILDTLQPVPGFEVPLPRLAPGLLDTMYNEDIMERVDERYMDRYDENKNGVLDPEEFRALLDREDEAAEFDQNKDGILTRAELAAWVQDERGGRGRGRDRDDDGDRRRRDNDDDDDDDEREDDDREAREEIAQRYSQFQEAAPFSARSDTDVVERTRNEAEKMFDEADRDDNKRIEGDEFRRLSSELRSADVNGDDAITLDEITAKLLADSRSSYRALPIAARLPENLARLDANRDGQIAMHEFTRNWERDSEREFMGYDRNNDGMITAEEATTPAGEGEQAGRQLASAQDGDRRGRRERGGEEGRRSGSREGSGGDGDRGGRGGGPEGFGGRGGFGGGGRGGFGGGEGGGRGGRGGFGGGPEGFGGRGGFGRGGRGGFGGGEGGGRGGRGGRGGFGGGGFDPSAMFTRFDANGDGEIEPDELPEQMRGMAERFGIDGPVSIEELGERMQRAREEGIGGGRGG
ncbi:MAG: hypothetical protein WDZ59_13035 [Pirellulales bacterium]